MTPPSEEVDINFADFKGLEIDDKLDYFCSLVSQVGR
jgi:hypothetical protein